MFRSAWIPLSLLVAACASPSLAQDAPFDARRDEPAHTAAQEGHSAQSLSPEMWFYEKQLERHNDPAMAVRRKAELRGLQRAERLASQQWFGISNSRPLVMPTPSIGGIYAPFWSGNSYDPNRWRPYALQSFGQRSGTNRY
jgi:hypothetical protein